MSFTNEELDEKLDLDSVITTRAQTGDSSAQLEVGKAYYHATHIENNRLEAFKWIESSAEQGSMEAQFILGDMFALGHGVDQNIRIAHDWYTKSALQDYPKALIRIHNLYEEDKKMYCRGELNSEEKGQNEPAFKLKNNVRELNEYRLDWMQSKNLLGNTVDYFSELFESLKESKDDDKDAQHKLGFLYQHGYGIRRIAKRAIECYTKAAELGHIGAQYNLGLLYQENHDIKFNYRQSFKWYTKAAEGGSTPAQNRLAYFYEKGLVVEVDYSKALYWYTQAATDSSKGAMLNIARIYRKGLIGGEPDHAESIRWYTMAAKHGSSVAKNCLYQLSQRIDIAGINPIAKEALLDTESSIKSRLCSKLRLDVSNLINSSNFDQLKELASHALVGDGNAMFELGYKYLGREEFTQDREIGFTWIKKAAQSGLIKAQLYLARIYEEGITDFIKQDYYRAKIWYYKVAKTKNSEARNKIGLFYYQGHGLRKDPLESSKWFTWSADQGNSDGQYMLGILRQRGEGLREDLLESKIWFKKSASQGNPHALYQFSKLNLRDKDFSIKHAIELDQERERRIFMYAANHGSPDAQLLLAKTYENEEIPAESFKHYLMAAKNGNMEAKYKIGLMYLHGRGVEQNYKEAFKWICDSAKGNFKKAESLFATPIEISDTSIDYYCVLEMFRVVTNSEEPSLEYNIGYIFEKGLGDPNSRNFIRPNPAKAMFWYKEAERKDNSKALYRLGKMYQEEKGVLRNNSVALYYFKKAAKLKNIDSLNILALMYLGGVKVQEDSQKAFCLYQEAANFGCPNARSVLALLYGAEEKDRGEYLNTHIEHMWQQAAAEGNVTMQYQLGLYHQSRRNIESAIKWLRLAAREKFTEAYYKLGEIYEKEIEYRNYSEAIRMYESARKKNHDMAIYRLARLYHHGSGVPRDYDKAFLLYAEAATQGNKMACETLDIIKVGENKTTSKEFKSALAMCEHVAQRGDIDFQYKVGYVYETNLNLIDKEKAHKWYSMASSKSHKEATYRLGLLHKSGLGCSQNWLEAIKYFGKAMNLGSSEACFELGEIYYFGNGVDIDKSRAEDHYFEAAKQGNSNAQYTLGKLYEEGDILKKDQLEALKWYRKAYFQENAMSIARLHSLDFDLDCKDIFEQKLYSILENFEAKHKDVEIILNAPGDREFYGSMFFKLGIMYFNRTGIEDNFKKAWGNFNTANKVHNNKAAGDFINCIDDVVNISNKDIYHRKFEMFYRVIDGIDGEQLYKIGMLYFNGKHLDDDKNVYAVEPNYKLSFEFLNKSSVNGFPQSHKQLGDMYYYGKGVNINHEEGLKHHVSWANNQNGDENFHTGLSYCEHKSDIEQNKRIGFIYMNKAVNQRNVSAQNYLGRVFYSDSNTNNSEYRKHATELHKYFADSNQILEDSLNLGLLYYDGLGGINEDHSIAVIYLKKASGEGDPTAQRYLGDMYYYGDIVEKNHEKAKKLHKSSADKSSNSECFDIGREYYKGTTHTEKNPDIALIYINEAAKAVKYQRYLADMYYYGDGIDMDQIKANELHERSAIQQKSEENFNIGKEYYTGSENIKRNYSIAFIYLSRVDSENTEVTRYTEATRYLGDMYFYGNGVDKNEKKALELHEISASLSEDRENFEIGQEYFKGSNILEKSHSLGLFYITKAWYQQLPEAGRYLADMYYHGKGAEIDLEKATELYKSSANQLRSYENFEIGRKYYEGSDDSDDSEGSEKIKMNRTAGLVYLTKAADQGSPDAKRYLGDIYYYGDGVEKNQEKAKELYESSANQLPSEKCFSIGQDYYKGLNNTKANFLIGFIYLTKAADKKHPYAQRYLGDIYCHGGDVVKNEKKGMDFYNSSASLFSANDCYKAGLEYYKGSENIKKNLSIAIIYFSAAADKKNAGSQKYLGDMYYYGEGVEKDQGKAINLYKSSADGCTPSDSVTFGLEYYRGSANTMKNYDTALIYFSKGSGTDVRATRYLGDMYYDGAGVEKNEKKAFELYNSSPSQPDRIEDLRIGREYLRGSEHVNKNHSIALVYLRKSFKQGSGFAAQHLGDMYLYGNGIERNIREAMGMFTASANLLLSSECFEIGQEYFKGSRNVSRNHQVARIYLTKAVNGGISQAERYLRETQD